MNNNGDSGRQRLSSDVYAAAFDVDDDDIIDIRPRRQRGSVTSRQTPAYGDTQPYGASRTQNAQYRNAPARSAADRQPQSAAAQTRPVSAGGVRRQASPGIPNPPARSNALYADTRGGTARPQGGQPRSASQSAPRRHDSAPNARNDSARSIPARSGTRGDGNAVTSPSRAVTTHSSRRKKSGKMTVGCVIRRVLLVVLTLILFAVGVILAVANTLANGPSETARNKAVMSAMQASATKWAPGLFLSDEVVDQIIADSKVVVTDVKPITDVTGKDGEAPTVISEDRWAKAIDGMIYENVNGKTFKGYVLLIKDPSRVSVAISTEDFSYASRIFEIADQYGAIAAINGGEFPDNGVQTGANPIGLTYFNGKCVRDVEQGRTFIGFTNDNKLYVEEGTTREQADAVGIRDGVAFQTGNTLITNDGENITYYYADSNTGVAQRTGIGQLADGTVMFLVTDGRTASSMGATKNDIIDTFADYGAITAGLLDGGSSAMLYYRDWYDKYNVDRDQLDEWQIMGLVNRYKAFTNPRAIPTFFIVK